MNVEAREVQYIVGNDSISISHIHGRPTSRKTPWCQFSSMHCRIRHRSCTKEDIQIGLFLQGIEKPGYSCLKSNVPKNLQYWP